MRAAYFKHKLVPILFSVGILLLSFFDEPLSFNIKQFMKNTCLPDVTRRDYRAQSSSILRHHHYTRESQSIQSKVANKAAMSVKGNSRGESSSPMDG